MNSIDKSGDAESCGCAACGSHAVSERMEAETFFYGAGRDRTALTVEVPKISCSDCGLVLTDERAEKLRNDAVCRHLQIFTPEEIFNIRTASGLSQTDFSEISRIGRASLSRWETGDIHQNGSSDSLLYLLSFPENIERLKDRWKQVMLIPPHSPTRGFRALSKEQIQTQREKSKQFSLHC